MAGDAVSAPPKSGVNVARSEISIKAVDSPFLACGNARIRAAATYHNSMLRRDGTGMVSTINEVDTTDERSLKPFET